MSCTKPSIPLIMKPGTEEKQGFYSPALTPGLEQFLLLQQREGKKETPWELQENHCLLVTVKNVN